MNDQLTRSIGDSAWQFQASRWQTNSLLIARGGHVIVADPTFAEVEIEAIRAVAHENGPAGVDVLVTHSHFDHVCGLAYFDEAEVVVAADTRLAFDSGEASRQLALAAREWGRGWPCSLRYDHVVTAGESFRRGPFRVETFLADGNSGDGIAYVFPDEGILVAGDFLAAACYPTFDTSLVSAIATCERMLGALDRYDLQWVLPGHGPVLAPEEARAVGAADLDYLESLQSTGTKLLGEGTSQGEALLELYAVEPPRPVLPDFAIYRPRVTNARAAWLELNGRPGAGAALNRQLGES